MGVSVYLQYESFLSCRVMFHCKPASFMAANWNDHLQAWSHISCKKKHRFLQKTGGWPWWNHSFTVESQRKSRLVQSKCRTVLVRCCICPTNTPESTVNREWCSDFETPCPLKLAAAAGASYSCLATKSLLKDQCWFTQVSQQLHHQILPQNPSEVLSHRPISECKSLHATTCTDSQFQSKATTGQNPHWHLRCLKPVKIITI